MTNTKKTDLPEALLPCPFCNAAAHFDSDADGWHWIECESCGMQGNRGASLMEDCRPKLREAWNTRAGVHPDVASGYARGWEDGMSEAATLSAAAVVPDMQHLHDLLYAAQRQTTQDAMHSAITAARIELSNLRAAPTGPQKGAESYPPLPEPELESTQCDSTMRYTTLRSYSERQLLEFADDTAALRARGAAPSEAEILNRTGCAEFSPGTAEYDLELIRWYRLWGSAPQPPAALPGQDADPLQGAANWLLDALVNCNVRDIQHHLFIGFNRAKCLHDAAMATKGRAEGGEPT